MRVRESEGERVWGGEGERRKRGRRDDLKISYGESHTALIPLAHDH